MEDYHARIKFLSDQLSLAGTPVSTRDLVLHTLGCLDAEHNVVVVGLNRQHDLTWEEMHSKLLAFESRL